MDAFVTHGDGRPKTLAYALATAYHETGRQMMPVREGFAKTDAQARQRVNRLAAQRGPNSAVAKYAKPQPPHGHVYYGRGQVQLTWKKNYETSSADAGIDLVRFPDKVLDPVIGARILVRGLLDGRWNGHGHGIAHYLPDSGTDDLRNARRTVNITDKWQQIADYYRSFLGAIETAGGVPTTVVSEDVDTPTDTPGAEVGSPETEETIETDTAADGGATPLDGPSAGHDEPDAPDVADAPVIAEDPVIPDAPVVPEVADVAPEPPKTGLGALWDNVVGFFTGRSR